MNGEGSAPLSEDLSGWPPEGEIFAVRGVSLAVLDGEHPFHAAEKGRAAANWRREVAANPALFDGRMVFQHRLGFHAGKITGEAYMIPYSTFLWWRKQPGGAGGLHLFAFPVLVSADGALVAIRMGPNTANPGQVYFAAGSLDGGDVVDGYCDVDGNMRREVLEETGLDLASAEAGPELYASHRDRRITLYRLYRFPLSAGEMVRAIERHHDEEGEIAGAVAIRSADPAAHPYAPSMLPLLEWYFGRAGQD